MKDSIYRYLETYCRGHERATKAAILAEYFHTNLRAINSEISILRKEGRLVGSSKEPPYGYFVPVTDKEIKGYLKTFKDELFDMLETFNIQKRAARRYKEQKVQKEFIQTTSGQLAFAGV